MKKNWLRKLAAAMALTTAMSSGMTPPAQAQAAAKDITVKAATKINGIKLAKTNLTVHKKTAIQLKVSQGPKDVTAKAKYKSSNAKVISVNRKGKATFKKNGTATLTVKYGGKSKKLKVSVAKHSWKAHTKVKKVWALRSRCACGAICSGDPEEEEEHDIMHIKTGTAGNTHDEYYTLNVKYTDYYTCSCGTKKKGQPEPENEHSKKYYEEKGYKTSEYKGK